jgi:hypothetical protein
VYKFKSCTPFCRGIQRDNNPMENCTYLSQRTFTDVDHFLIPFGEFCPQHYALFTQAGNHGGQAPWAV